jgi:hypothetical protein
MKLIDAKKVYQNISWDCPFKMLKSADVGLEVPGSDKGHVKSTKEFGFISKCS